MFTQRQSGCLVLGGVFATTGIGLLVLGTCVFESPKGLFWELSLTFAPNGKERLWVTWAPLLQYHMSSCPCEVSQPGLGTWMRWRQGLHSGSISWVCPSQPPADGLYLHSEVPTRRARVRMGLGVGWELGLGWELRLELFVQTYNVWAGTLVFSLGPRYMFEEGWCSGGVRRAPSFSK